MEPTITIGARVLAEQILKDEGLLELSMHSTYINTMMKVIELNPEKSFEIAIHAINALARSQPQQITESDLYTDIVVGVHPEA